MNGMGKKPLWRLLPLLAILLLFTIMPTACGSTQTKSTATPPATPPGTTITILRAPAGIIGLGSVTWSPDGKYIAAGTDYPAHVFVWDAHSGKLLLTYQGNSASVSSIAWSPDSKYIASGDTGYLVKVWDAKTGTTLLTYNKQGPISVVHALAWSPDGTYIASAAEDRAIQVWDAKTGATRVTYTPHTYNIDTSISSVAWSPDGTYIASNGYPDGSVQVWDAKTGATIVDFKGHTGYAGTVGWSPDGKYIASSDANKTIQIWEALNGHVQYTYRGQAVGSLAWSPNGTYIASSSMSDGTIWIWQAI